MSARRRAISAITLFVALAGAGRAAQAAVITVDTTSNTGTPGNCEFLEAVQAAQTNVAIDGCPAGGPGVNKIVFAPALAGQTITYATVPSFNGLQTIVDAEFRAIVLQGTGNTDGIQVNGADVVLRGVDLRAGGSGNGVTLLSGNLTVNNSSVQGRLGMNAFGSGSLVTVNNSTVASTETAAASDIAIRAGSATSLAINNSTIVASVGKGIDASSSSGTVNVYSSIVVGATPINGSSTNSGGTLLATSTANAGLAATLAYNGGTTRTFMLTSGAAINGGDCASSPVARYDQRYYFNGSTGTRAVGAACDVGAYETGAQDLLTDRVFANGYEL